MRNLAFFMSSLSAVVLGACSSGSDGLDAIQADIVSDFKNVEQLSADAYLSLDPKTTLVLDIREPEEFAVSRLPGAIWVSPDLDAESALIQIGDVTNKEIIVYCSVGRRSSIFADRIQKDFTEMGAVSVSNLEQGIFGWHNESRELVNADGKTDAIHPYDEIWKRYVVRKEMARYKPKEKPSTSR